MTETNAYSRTLTQAFTVTHAEYLASKLSADLSRIYDFYGRPSLEEIKKYHQEIVLLLMHGYLDKIEYGFVHNGNWVLCVQYTAYEALDRTDNDPGRIPTGKNISGASFTSYLSYSNKWWNLSNIEREAFKNKLPFQRVTGEGYRFTGQPSQDLTYSAGGTTLSRKCY